MDQCRPSVLMVGAIEHHEFRAAFQWLRSNTQLDAVERVGVALEWAQQQGRRWHTVIIAQSRPGEFAATDVDRIARAMPFAHLVALLGSCCEGETRSGRPWPGVVRVFWHQWEARCRSELRLDVRPTTWQLPRTTSDVERALHALSEPPPRSAGLIAIVTRRAACYHGLAVACRLAGYCAVWKTSPALRDVDGAAAIVWEGQSLDDGELWQLQQLRAGLPGVPIIALLGFPRFDMVQRATEAGVAAVVSLPCLLPDLWTTLRETVRQR